MNNTILLKAYMVENKAGKKIVVIDKNNVSMKNLKDDDFEEVTLILSDNDLGALLEQLESNDL